MDVNLVKEIEQKTVSITDLIQSCNVAAQKMSANNPNRNLLMNCAYAMRQLVDRLARYEHPEPEQVQ